MTNSEKFNEMFGIYAEEFWAFPKDKMLDWLQYDVPDTNVGDTISRQAVVDAIYHIKCNLQMMDDTQTADKMMNGLRLGENAIKMLPSAEPGWIPVTERLPDKMGTYLVTLDYKEHGTGVMSLWFHNEEIGWDLRVADEVTAWMPLPKPWKGETDDN